MVRWFLLIAIFSISCTQKYIVPEILPGKPFPGISDYFEDSDRVRVISTHGMCSQNHDFGWVEGMAKGLLTSLGARYSPTHAETNYPSDEDPVVTRYKFEFPIREGKILEANFLVWGRYVDQFRDRLAYDTKRNTASEPDEPHRAKINHVLRKTIISECFVDPVVYLGANGNPIRDGMRRAVCDILDGQYTSDDGQGDALTKSNCKFNDDVELGSPTVLMPQSLGSSILFDAFAGLDDTDEGSTIAERLSALSVHLISNQLPFIRLGNDDFSEQPTALETKGSSSGFGSLNMFLENQISGIKLRGENPEKFDVIVYTDPNDALSFRLDSSAFRNDIEPDVELRNVLVSNGPAWFNLLENPIEAHDYRRPKVFDLIANGWPE